MQAGDFEKAFTTRAPPTGKLARAMTPAEREQLSRVEIEAQQRRAREEQSAMATAEKAKFQERMNKRRGVTHQYVGAPNLHTDSATGGL